MPAMLKKAAKILVKRILLVSREFSMSQRLNESRKLLDLLEIYIGRQETDKTGLGNFDFL